MDLRALPAALGTAHRTRAKAGARRRRRTLGGSWMGTSPARPPSAGFPAACIGSPGGRACPDPRKGRGRLRPGWRRRGAPPRSTPRRRRRRLIRLGRGVAVEPPIHPSSTRPSPTSTCANLVVAEPGARGDDRRALPGRRRRQHADHRRHPRARRAGQPRHPLLRQEAPEAIHLATIEAEQTCGRGVRLALAVLSAPAWRATDIRNPARPARAPRSR